MKNRIRIFIAVGLAFLLSACGQIPTRELSQYRSAFAEVQGASVAVLIDYSEAIEAANKRKDSATRPAAVAPKRFSTELDSVGKQPDAIEVRRNALLTIETYNNVLLTLAEGKSVESVQASAGGFINAASEFAVSAGSKAVPGLSAIVDAVQIIVGEMEKARLRQEFEQAVRKGAPVIKKMVGLLIEDRQDHLALRADEANLHHVEVVNDITSQIVEVRSLFSSRKAPAGDNPLPDVQDALNAAIKPAAAAFAFALPVKLAYGKSGAAFSTQDGVLAGQIIGQIRERVEAYKQNIEQYEKLKSALNNYGALLVKMQTALDALVRSLDAPQNVEDVTNQILQVTFSLKKDFEAYRASRKASN